MQRFSTGTYTVGTGGAIFFKTSGSTTSDRYGAKIGAVRASEATGAADFRIDLEKANASGMQEVFRIRSGGNVGILTSTPETELDVNGTCTSQLLQLRKQDSAPSDPENDKSVIYMDSSGDIKVKINVGGTTVTRTLATYA